MKLFGDDLFLQEVNVQLHVLGASMNNGIVSVTALRLSRSKEGT